MTVTSGRKLWELTPPTSNISISMSHTFYGLTLSITIFLMLYSWIGITRIKDRIPGPYSALLETVNILIPEHSWIEVRISLCIQWICICLHYMQLNKVLYSEGTVYIFPTFIVLKLWAYNTVYALGIHWLLLLHHVYTTPAPFQFMH